MALIVSKILGWIQTNFFQKAENLLPFWVHVLIFEKTLLAFIQNSIKCQTSVLKVDKTAKGTEFEEILRYFHQLFLTARLSKSCWGQQGIKKMTTYILTWLY